MFSGKVRLRKPKEAERPWVLIAPDKFKGSLSAREVADALGNGLSPRVNVKKIPLADGGEGSIEAIVAAGFKVVNLDSYSPAVLSRPAQIARKGDLYFIEAAEFCGLANVRGELEPMRATTIGVGYAVRAALDLGAQKIILGVGGTSSTDGGSGFLIGLGAKFLDQSGDLIPTGGGGLAFLDHIDFSSLDPRLESIEIILASDVDTPLLGPFGAAELFAPQKGATAQQVKILELGLIHYLTVLDKQAEPWGGRARTASLDFGSGAGGGLGFAVLLLGAHRTSGADCILDLLKLDDLLAGCILVVTGEGSLDKQSLAGKLPVALAARALARGIPVAAVVGSCQLSEEDSSLAGFTQVRALDQLDSRSASDKELSARLLEEVGSTLVLPSFFIHSSLLMGMLNKLTNKRKVD